MGAKAVLSGAIMLVIGVYAISLKNVQVTGWNTAQSHVNRMQNERVVDAALILALNEVTQYDGNFPSPVTMTGHALGSDITYTVSGVGSPVQIRLTITRGSFTETIQATATKLSSVNGHGKGKDIHRNGYRKLHRGSWQLGSAFVQKG